MYYLSTRETPSTLSSSTLQSEMSPHGIPPRLLTVCLIASPKSISAGTSSRTRNKPLLTLRLAIQTLVPSRSRIDGLRYIVPTRQREQDRHRFVTSSTLIPIAIIIRLSSIERSRTRTHLTRFSPHPNVSAQTITFCGPVQLVFETGGPVISGIFRVNWLMRSPSLLLTKFVQWVSLIADFTR
jgi:hypothetical protein